MGSAGPYANLHLAPDTTQFLQAGRPCCRPTNSVKALVFNYYIHQVNGVKLADIVYSVLCVCLCVCAHAVSLVWMSGTMYCSLRNVLDSCVKSWEYFRMGNILMWVKQPKKSKSAQSWLHLSIKIQNSGMRCQLRAKVNQYERRTRLNSSTMAHDVGLKSVNFHPHTEVPDSTTPSEYQTVVKETPNSSYRIRKSTINESTATQPDSAVSRPLPSEKNLLRRHPQAESQILKRVQYSLLGKSRKWKLLTSTTRIVVKSIIAKREKGLQTFCQLWFQYRDGMADMSHCPRPSQHCNRL